MALPKTYRKIVVQRLTTDFAAATEIVQCPLPSVGPTDVIIRTKYVGVNASDINLAKGRYFVNAKPPLDVGFEAVGVAVDVGRDVKHVKAGQTVACMAMSCYGEYLCLPAKNVWPIPSADPEYIAFIVSGLTAAISLDKRGFIKKGDKVLITSAAGGTGNFAVQYAKASGCHVIGTCSSAEKKAFLKSLGCDRVIDYKLENVGDVLAKEYSNGVDVVWETIGGSMFETCLKHLAIGGRMVIIGFISQYGSEDGNFPPMNLSELPMQLLRKSQIVSGFMLFQLECHIPEYQAKFNEMNKAKTLRGIVDTGDSTPEGAFVGLESVARAVKYLHSGKSKGKIVVKMP